MRKCKSCTALIKALDAYIRKADNDLEDQLKAEGYIKPKKTLHYAKDIEDAVADALVNETDYFVKEAKKCDDLDELYKKLAEIIGADTITADLEKIFAEKLALFLPEYVGYYLKQTDRALKLEQVSKRTTAWVQSWSRDLSDLMKTTSTQQLESLLVREMNDGGDIGQFCIDLMNSGMEKEGKGEYWTEYYRARRVAVTEVLRAHSVAQQEAYMQSPAVESKAWKHTGDYRNDPRENHVKMDGQTVEKSKPYVLIGADGATYYPMYPRDTNLPAKESINCHCLSQPVVSEKALGLSTAERKRLQQKAIDEMDDEWEKELDAKNKAKAGIEDT